MRATSLALLFSAIVLFESSLAKKLLLNSANVARHRSKNCASMPPVRDGRLMILNNQDYLNSLAVWREAPSIAPPTASMPKIAVLMMIYQRIVFPMTWQRLIEDAPPGAYTMIIHSMTTAQVPDFFKIFLMDGNVPSAHCNTVYLMVRMMEQALLDPAVTHVTIVSGDTIPIRTFANVAIDLKRDDRSRFCVDADWTRAETWYTLRRDQAYVITKNQNKFHAFISARAMSCPDEDSFYWALSERNESLLNKCAMMTDWSDTPKAWSRVANECNCPTFLQSVKDPASCGAPAVFHRLTRQGVYELVHSSEAYWFVRKFPGDGIDSRAMVVNGTGEGFDEDLDNYMARYLREQPLLSSN